MLALLVTSALAVPPDLENYVPLLGRWTRGSSSETWVEAGDDIYGVAFSHDGAEPYWEVMQLVASDAGVDLVARPLGGDPVAFRATGGWMFRNGAHDFPQWISYERKGRKLVAEIGDPRQRWKWRLAADAPDEDLEAAEQPERTPVASGVSRDGVLGFTAGTSEAGSWVRIWRRQPDGAWLVLFDLGG